MSDNEPPAIFISGCCKGEFCTMCGEAAAHKVAEEIQYDDPHPARHGFTAYVCHECFVKIMGSGSAMKLLLSFPSEYLASEFAKRANYFVDDLFAISTGVYAEIDNIPDSDKIKADLLDAASVIGGVEVKTRQH